MKDSRRSDEDPFAGIGLGSYGGFSKPNKQNDVFDSKIDLFHIGETEQNQSNNFDDPFNEESFSNLSANKNGLGMSTPNKNPMASNAQSANNVPSSTQYNFDNSQMESQKNDDFQFDDIDINLDDLNMFESPMPKVNAPPETQRKQPVNTGMPMNSSRSNSSFPAQSQNSQNPGRQNMNRGPMDMSNQNPPGMGDMNRDREHQPNNDRMNLNIFNTAAPPKSTFQNQPHHNQPGRGGMEDSMGLGLFEDQKSNRTNHQPSNMMSLNNSQMSAEPQVIQRGGPPNRQGDQFQNNFNTAIPQQRNNPPNNFPGMNGSGGQGNFGTSNPMQSNFGNDMGRTNNSMQSNYGGMSSSSGPTNDMPNANNMLVPVDPFAGADTTGYNQGSLAGGFNTMGPSKAKKKNPFAKGFKDKTNAMQANKYNNSNGSSSSGMNNMFGTSFSNTNNFSAQPQNPGMDMFATMNTPNTGGFGSGPFGQPSQTPSKPKGNPFAKGPSNNAFSQPQNTNMGFGNPPANQNMGMQPQQNQANGGGDFDDLFS